MVSKGEQDPPGEGSGQGRSLTQSSLAGLLKPVSRQTDNS